MRWDGSWPFFEKAWGKESSLAKCADDDGVLGGWRMGRGFWFFV